MDNNSKRKRSKRFDRSISALSGSQKKVDPPEATPHPPPVAEPARETPPPTPEPAETAETPAATPAPVSADPTAFRPLRDNTLQKGRKFVSLHRMVFSEPARAVGTLTRQYYAKALLVVLLAGLVVAGYYGYQEFRAWQESDERAREQARDAAIDAGTWEALSAFLEAYPDPGSKAEVRDAFADAYKVEIARIFDLEADPEAPNGSAERLQYVLERLNALQETWDVRMGGALPEEVVVRLESGLDTLYFEEVERIFEHGNQMLAEQNLAAKRHVNAALTDMEAVWTEQVGGRDIPEAAQERIAQHLRHYNLSAGQTLLLELQDASQRAETMIAQGQYVPAVSRWRTERDALLEHAKAINLPEERVAPLREGAEQGDADVLDRLMDQLVEDLEAGVAEGFGPGATLSLLDGSAAEALAAWNTLTRAQAGVLQQLGILDTQSTPQAQALAETQTVVRDTLLALLDNELASARLAATAGTGTPVAETLAAWRTARGTLQRAFAELPQSADLAEAVALTVQEHDHALVNTLVARALEANDRGSFEALLAAFPEGDPQRPYLEETAVPAYVRLLIQQGDFEAAARFPVEDEADRVAIEFAQGCIAYWRDDDPERAQAVFTRLAQGAVDSRDTPRLLSLMYKNTLRGDADGEAFPLGDLIGMVELDPRSPTAGYETFSLGYFLLRDGQASRALYHLEQARSLSELLPVEYYLTLALVRTGEAGAAEAEALATDPNQPGPFRVRATLLWWEATVGQGLPFEGGRALGQLEGMLEGLRNTNAGDLAAFNREAGTAWTADELTYMAGFIHFAYYWQRDRGIRLMAQVQGEEYAQAARWMRLLAEALWPVRASTLPIERVRRVRTVIPPDSGVARFWPLVGVSALSTFYMGFHEFDRETSLRELESSSTQFSRLAQLCPVAGPMAALYRARAQVLRGGAGAAVRQFRDLIERVPRYSEAHYWLGDAYLGLGEDHLADGIEQLRIAADLDKDNPVAVAAPPAYFRLAEVAAERDGEDAQSAAEYRRLAREWYGSCEDDYLLRQFPITRFEEGDSDSED